MICEISDTTSQFQKLAFKITFIFQHNLLLSMVDRSCSSARLSQEVPVKSKTTTETQYR